MGIRGPLSTGGSLPGVSLRAGDCPPGVGVGCGGHAAYHGRVGPRGVAPVVPWSHRGPYRLTSPRAQGTLANIFSRSATLTHPVLAWTCITYTWKELPTGFFFEKSSKSQNRPFSPRKLDFFRLRAATLPYRIRAAATAALSENFGHGATFERDLSLGFNSSEKTEGTLPEELDRAEAIQRGAATSK